MYFYTFIYFFLLSLNDKQKKNEDGEKKEGKNYIYCNTYFFFSNINNIYLFMEWNEIKTHIRTYTYIHTYTSK